MSYRTSLRWLGWASIVTFFNQKLYTVKIVTGKSMQPTLNPDTSPWRDVLLFDRTIMRLGKDGYRCERGDVVALRSPTDPHEMLVKRIIALGGDVVQTLHPYPDPFVKVPEGYMWVEGDERFHTRDSNHFGPVPLALLDSKSTFIVWPPPRFGPIHTPSTRALAQTRVFSTAWRLENDAAARERRRKERVRIAPTR